MVGAVMNEYMTSAEVARLLRVDKSTVCRWRLAGTGPRVTWLSPSLPRYARRDVEEWLRGVAA
ncbi:helix-turn-helix transcriptional regulator [Brachybacterium saurashtrense]|uniref:DNA-binding protein n=1 Tax=Brachybacterium saurashtrense TaxID=556288 RepID=A0A345YPK8_9MICO|nr:DNA-binding protein [Brachybacterium saurashtrense]RRR24879.1 DNA-binding protein [Brachybacterium saurashtrense]